MKYTKLIWVGLIVVILVVGYLAFVGIAKAEDDVGPTNDPLDQKREPIAYGNFYLSLNIHNNILGGIKVTIESFDIKGYPYTPGGLQVVYNADKLDLLGLFGHNDVTVTVECSVTGPGRWTGNWNPDDLKVEVGEGDHKIVDLKSGNMVFWDAGSYVATLDVSIESRDGSGLKASTTLPFTVSTSGVS